MKIMVAILVFCILIFIATPAQAQQLVPTNLSIGVNDNQRHAGVNFLCQAYAKDKLTGKMFKTPAVLGLDSGYLKIAPTDCFVLIKPFILNEGAVKQLDSSVADIVLDYNSELGGFLVDTNRLGIGSHGIKLSVNHKGGETVYQIFIFRIKCPYNITDQNGMILDVVDPETAMRPEEERLARYSSGFIVRDGRNVNPNHKIRIEYPTTSSGVEEQNIVIKVYSDNTMRNPGIARVQIRHSQGVTQVKETEGGQAAFNVPPGSVRIMISCSEGEVYPTGKVPNQLQPGEKVEFSAYVKKGGNRQ